MVKTSKLSSPSTNINIRIEEDRISRLPNVLIHHVLSFLNTKYAVQTCVLSKRWIHIWKSLPFLNFHISSYVCGEDDDEDDSGDENDTLYDFVDRVLLLRDDCSIERFKISWHCVEDDNAFLSVNRWIDAAIKRNVQEVSIHLCQLYGFTYKVSPRLLNCKTLKKLTLSFYCKDDHSYARVILAKLMSLPQLKVMCLNRFLVDDIELSKKLFSSCPLLETLYIVDCDIQTDNRRNFSVESLSLKHFLHSYVHGSGHRHQVYDIKPEIINLSAPNLNSFTFETIWRYDYNVGNCSDQLSSANLSIRYHHLFEKEKLDQKEVYARRMVKLLVTVDKVKRLDLSPGFLEVLSGASELVNCQLPCLSHLQSLRLGAWFTRCSLRAIAYLFRISPNIKTLILIGNPNGVTWSDIHPYRQYLHKLNLTDIGNDLGVGFSLPGMLSELRVVRIENAEGCDGELKILNFLLNNAKGLEEIALYPCSTVDSLPKLKRKYNKRLREHRKSLYAHQNGVEGNKIYLHIVN